MATTEATRYVPRPSWTWQTYAVNGNGKRLSKHEPPPQGTYKVRQGTYPTDYSDPRDFYAETATEQRDVWRALAPTLRSFTGITGEMIEQHEMRDLSMGYHASWNEIKRKLVSWILKKRAPGRQSTNNSQSTKQAVVKPVASLPGYSEAVEESTFAPVQTLKRCTFFNESGELVFNPKEHLFTLDRWYGLIGHYCFAPNWPGVRLRHRTTKKLFQNPEVFACGACVQDERLCHGHRENVDRKCKPCEERSLICSNEERIDADGEKENAIQDHNSLGVKLNTMARPSTVANLLPPRTSHTGPVMTFPHLKDTHQRTQGVKRPAEPHSQAPAPKRLNAMPAASIDRMRSSCPPSPVHRQPLPSPQLNPGPSQQQPPTGIDGGQLPRPAPPSSGGPPTNTPAASTMPSDKPPPAPTTPRSPPPRPSLRSHVLSPQNSQPRPGAQTPSLEPTRLSTPRQSVTPMQSPMNRSQSQVSHRAPPVRPVPGAQDTTSAGGNRNDIRRPMPLNFVQHNAQRESVLPAQVPPQPSARRQNSFVPASVQASSTAHMSSISSDGVYIPTPYSSPNYAIPQHSQSSIHRPGLMQNSMQMASYIPLQNGRPQMRQAPHRGYPGPVRGPTMRSPYPQMPVPSSSTPPPQHQSGFPSTRVPRPGLHQRQVSTESNQSELTRGPVMHSAFVRTHQSANQTPNIQQQFARYPALKYSPVLRSAYQGMSPEIEPYIDPRTTSPHHHSPSQATQLPEMSANRLSLSHTQTTRNGYSRPPIGLGLQYQSNSNTTALSASDHLLQSSQNLDEWIDRSHP